MALSRSHCIDHTASGSDRCRDPSATMGLVAGKAAHERLRIVRLPLLQVREERMNLDMQTLSMERELRVYGESAPVPCRSHAAS